MAFTIKICIVEKIRVWQASIITGRGILESSNNFRVLWKSINRRIQIEYIFF
jgi:hypothetical protein